MDAVFELVRDGSVRGLTIEAVAKRAGVGKPTIYKWWPSKAALVLAMFGERMATDGGEGPRPRTAEGMLRGRARRLVRAFNGPFGRVMADLIAEGQGDPAVLRQLYDEHVGPRRAATAAEVDRAKADGGLAADTDADLLMDGIFGPIYFRLLMGLPLTEAYADGLVGQALGGRAPAG